MICNCEAGRHEDPTEAIHPMFANVGGYRGYCYAAYVGPICNDCAANCYLPDGLGVKLL